MKFTREKIWFRKICCLFKPPPIPLIFVVMTIRVSFRETRENVDKEKFKTDNNAHAASNNNCVIKYRKTF